MNLLPDCDIVLVKQCIFYKILSEQHKMTDKKLSQKNWSSWHHQLHKEILTKKILIPKGSNILISVSGGQDSMTLLTLINDLKKLHNWSISVWPRFIRSIWRKNFNI